MSTVRVYKSTDPGAPAHPSNVRGSMAALLRACLVTGYGTGEYYKAPAGWEEPFEEIDHCACVRAMTGARQFFQIDDNQVDADVAKIRAFESMSSAGDGSGQWAAHYFGKWYSAAESQVWAVIADETTCYVLLCGNLGISRIVVHGFGEYESLKTGTPFNSFVVGHNISGFLDANESTLTFGRCYSINEKTWTAGTLHRGLVGDSPSAFSAINVGVNSGYGIADTYAGHGFGPLAEDVDWVALPLIIKAINDVDTTNGTLPVGMLRGVFQPLAKVQESFMEVQGADKIFIGAVTDGDNYCWGSILIAITGSWD